MHSLPKISVAIAVYNKEEQIFSTIESVLNQTFPASEIIIVNDGSTDSSEALIRSISDKRIKYVSQENKGAAAARNEAIIHCTNNYIALLDADDIWHADFLSQIVNAIQCYPDQKVFSTGIQIEGKYNKSFPAKYSIPEHSKIGVYNYFEGSYLSSLIYSSNVVLNKEVFEKVGYFDTEIKSGQDTDLWIRIGLKFPVVFIPKHLATYRYVPTSLSYSDIALKDKLRFNKFSEEEKNNPLLKRFLDLNRYSLAVSAKANKDSESHKNLLEAINLENLNLKQRFILKSPTWSIRAMKTLKLYLTKLGLQTTSF